MARPPEMTILAEVSSGLSLSTTVFSTKLESPGSAGTSTGSTGAAAAPWPAASKFAVRTDRIFTRSADVTVWIAFPA